MRSTMKPGALHPADGSTQGPSRNSTRYGLPLEVVSKAAARIPWIALAASISVVLLFVLDGAFDARMASAERTGSLILSAAVLIGMAGALLAAQKLDSSPHLLLDLGLLYEVAGAFALMTFEYGIPLGPDEPVRGVSKAAVWIYVFTLSSPATPLKSFAAALCAACMGPLAIWLSAQRNHQEIPFALAFVHLLLDFVMAGLAFLLSRRTYHLRAIASRARDMGSYQLETLIGQGGMGEVWRARHRLLARDAAIKVIRHDLLTGGSSQQIRRVVDRFEQEARATARLRSPHTVELYDFGLAESGAFYYVMELLSGIDLDTFVRRFGPQPPNRVRFILMQICESLAEAHALGLIHRDIKPRNIFLCRMGTAFDFVKVLDFGLVKQTWEAGESGLTGEDVTIGTPAFMAPEAILGSRTVDARADLYALGCVAYWLLTGQLVFEENGAIASALAHVQKTPVLSSERCEFAIPASLRTTVLSCLEKDPARRPQTASDLANQLERARDCGDWTRADAGRWWQANLPADMEFAYTVETTATLPKQRLHVDEMQRVL